MEQPIEVEWENNEQDHIIYAICHCHVIDKYDVRFYGDPGDGVVGVSPEFATLEEARDYAEQGDGYDEDHPVRVWNRGFVFVGTVSGVVRFYRGWNDDREYVLERAVPPHEHTDAHLLLCWWDQVDAEIDEAGLFPPLGPGGGYTTDKPLGDWEHWKDCSIRRVPGVATMDQTACSLPSVWEYEPHGLIGVLLDDPSMYTVGEFTYEITLPNVDGRGLSHSIQTLLYTPHPGVTGIHLGGQFSVVDKALSRTPWADPDRKYNWEVMGFWRDQDHVVCDGKTIPYPDTDEPTEERGRPTSFELYDATKAEFEQWMTRRDHFGASFCSCTIPEVVEEIVISRHGWTDREGNEHPPVQYGWARHE